MAISLQSIAKTKRNSLPPRIVIHGAQKVGKSTFGASAFKPIFLPIEDGLQGIETDAFPQLKTFDEVMQALESLKTPNDFGTVVVDSLDWLEPLIWDYTCRQFGWKTIEEPGYGKGYAEANAYWRAFFDSLNELRVNHGKAIILIAHSTVKRFENPDAEAFDRYELKLAKAPLGLAIEWADIIGFAQEETVIKTETAGLNKRTRGVGTGRRVLKLEGRPSYIAGNRFGLPDSIPLSWGDLLAAMNPAAPAASKKGS